MLARSVGVRRSSARLHDHRVLAAAIHVRGDLARGEHGLQRPGDGLDPDAQIVRLGAVDHHVELRLVLLEVGLDVEQAGVPFGPAHDRVAPRLDALIVGTADHDLQRRAAAAQAEARRAGRERRARRAAPRARDERADDLLLAARALAPGDQAHHHERLMRLAAAAGDREDARRLAVGREAAAGSPRPRARARRCSRPSIPGAR